MIKVLLMFTFLFIVSLHANIVDAAGKVLPQAKKSGVAKAQRTTGSGITISPKLRVDKKAIIINLGGLQNATNVSYTLIYKTNGIEEAAGGTVMGEGNAATRELLFGTCSGGVCRYHSNITNAHLEVQAKLKSGKTSIKRYRIRV